MTDEKLEEEQLELARSILRYLQSHQDAKDSLVGIAQWWLLREWVERQLPAVESAVSWLVSKDLVIRSERGPHGPYYELNQDKREEIVSFLKDE